MASPIESNAQISYDRLIVPANDNPCREANGSACRLTCSARSLSPMVIRYCARDHDQTSRCNGLASGAAASGLNSATAAETATISLVAKRW